ncbi:UNVERIFIED_ORG: hypothetical protein BDU10_6821 [Burkholderia sp. CF145]|nr:hypothetical protein PMI06_000913 [Burkholderia sp. BT03]SKD07736.1 hypothetical protein SAMN06266956_10155 [Paraburkholderia hospita]
MTLACGRCHDNSGTRCSKCGVGAGAIRVRASRARRLARHPEPRASYDGVQAPKSTNTSSRLTRVVDMLPVLVLSAMLQP